MSRFLQRPVRGPLARVVSNVWWYAGEGGPGVEVRLPTGLSQLIVNLADQDGVAFARTEGVLVQGPTTRPSPLWHSDQRLVAGVSFRPGGLRALLGPVLSELADEDVPLEALLPRLEVEQMRARLISAPSAEGCLEQLEAELLAWSRWPVDPRLGKALSGLQSGSVGAVARELGLCDRRLTLWFLEQVGLTPKRFARVRRFQVALAPILQGHELGEVALTCGFYDQAHLNREFRAFSGVNPTEYRARGPVHPNHLPDVASVQAGRARSGD